MTTFLDARATVGLIQNVSAEISGAYNGRTGMFSRPEETKEFEDEAEQYMQLCIQHLDHAQRFALLADLVRRRTARSDR